MVLTSKLQSMTTQQHIGESKAACLNEDSSMFYISSYTQIIIISVELELELYL